MVKLSDHIKDIEHVEVQSIVAEDGDEIPSEKTALDKEVLVEKKGRTFEEWLSDVLDVESKYIKHGEKENMFIIVKDKIDGETIRNIGRCSRIEIIEIVEGCFSSLVMIIEVDKPRYEDD